MKACRLPFSVDEAETSCECCARGEDGARNSVEGITGDNIGLSIFGSNNGLFESGDSAGEEIDSSGAAEGMMEMIGESDIEGDGATAGEEGDAAAGEAGET
ncbi:hypothetical protein TSUD_105680 [Trifolium subterraneum]|uniref:Uncharacterized protein n=1 Tax=Trifolium subterraneum TaxID=3900 RepID=A0A2Z6M4Y0_TRISU|nr:hypothetical protein TSUD_105680 [Trifolium subterraneum]